MIPAIEQHRSVRQFLDKPIPETVLTQALIAATRASTVGTMQLYSIIVTTDAELKQKLAPQHFNQPMVTQAPAVVTFCADVARFEQWCKQRDTQPAYQNFVWYVNAAIDALIASENFCLQAQNDNLGICYLGTTLYNASEIADILQLPRGVIPVTTVAVGYPDPKHYPIAVTPRLPLEAVVHKQTYHQPTPKQIDEFWRETENSDQTRRLITENGQPNLAAIFTQCRYTKKDNETFSKKYLEALRSQGFMQ